MSDVRSCSNHGFFEGTECNVCTSEGELLVKSRERRAISKFLCKVLRHEPDTFGLSINTQGWIDADELVAVTEDNFDSADRKTVAAIISLDDKRFEVEGNNIRAMYGHSIPVNVEGDTSDIPDLLYHGTAPNKVDSIMSEGLKPMNREEVHLTDDLPEAKSIGERHTDIDPVILEIDVKSLKDDQIIEKRGPIIYTTSEISPEYITPNPDL